MKKKPREQITHNCKTPRPQGAIGQMWACPICPSRFMLKNKGNDGSGRPGKVWVKD